MAAVVPADDEYSAIADAAPGAVVVLSEEGTIISANRAAGQLFACAPAQLQGRHWRDCLHPGAADAPGNIESLCTRLDDAAGTRSVDAVIAAADGSERPVTMAAGEYRHGGRQRRVISLLPRPVDTVTPPPCDENFANSLLVDRAAIGMTLTGPDGRWLRVNDTLAQMLGMTREELMAFDFGQVTYPEDRIRDTTAIDQMKAGEIRSFSHEKRYVRRDGRVIWVRIHVNGVFESGELRYWVTQIVDIDAERQAREDIRTVQLRLQSFVDHAPANIAMKDRNGRYILANGKFAASMGRDVASLIGRTLGDLGIDHPAVAQAVEDENRVLATGVLIEREVPNLHDPEVAIWATRFPIPGPNNTIAGTGLIANEITEAQRSERALLAQARTIGLLQRVAVAVNEAGDSRAAMFSCLQLVCQYMEWPCGHVSRPNAAGDRLESTGIWTAPSDWSGRHDAERVFAACACARGEGVAGSAWQDGLPRAGDGPHGLSLFADAGTVHAIAFPVETDGAPDVVFEFYTDSPPVLDERTSEVLQFVGVQVGHAIRREKTERSAALALKQLSYHIDNTAVGILSVDRDMRITAWSPKCEEIFGWSDAEVIGRSLGEIGMVHPADERVVTEAFAALDDPEVTSYSLFHRNLDKAGNVLHVEWYNSVLRDDNNAVISNLSIAVDRTAEVEIRRALDVERKIFISGPTLVMRWRATPGWPVVYISPNVESIAGYTVDEFTANGGRLADFIHPDDLDALVAQVREFHAGGALDLTVKPFRAFRKSGEIIWLQTYVSRLSSSEDIDHCVAYSIDITRMVELQEETRRQGQRLGNVIEATAVGTWEWDVDSDRVQINERYAAMLGYTIDELAPMTYQAWERLVHPDDLKQVLQALHDNYDGRSENYVVESRLRHRDGHWIWVSIRGNAVDYKPDGKPARVAGIHLDITDQKEAEATILETNAALKQSNVELERFAYVASHDLQEPLRMVASFTQLLKSKYSDELDDTAKEYIHFAFDGAQRMQQLIRDLLSYSRLGRQEIEETPVDVAALVGRVVKALQLSIDEADARVECNELPIVRGDAGQLYQLLQNLIGNAIKYRGEKRPRVDVYTKMLGDEIVWCIRDNGIGIEPEQSERVFEIFQRLHSRTEYPGTGIGLSVCKRIVERHGGRIWFEPGRDGGTRFCFTLAPDRYAAALPAAANV